MTLTKQEAIYEHRKMWRWIAEKTLERREVVLKSDYLDECTEGEWPKNCCYCCKYMFDTTGRCSSCPIKWSDDRTLDFCTSNSSPYTEWRLAVSSNDWEKAAEYAKVVAELPEREGRW